MNIPQTTIDRINAEADLYGFVIPYNGSKTFYIEDKVKGYQAGATEWAGKAQPAIDALEALLKELPTGNTLNFYFAKELVIKAREELAKYKEVTNG